MTFIVRTNQRKIVEVSDLHKRWQMKEKKEEERERKKREGEENSLKIVG